MSSRNLESFLSFPGLGIEEFKINSVAFKIGSFEIVWYGILITLGIIAAVGYVLWRAHQEKIKSDDVLDLAIYVVLAGLIGARLYYVLTNLSTYVTDNIGETLYNFVATWKGGLAIYGGIIGGSIAAAIFLKVKHLNIMRVFDMLGPAAMLGQLIGRWGNFMNAEAFGDETTLPWRMGIRNKYHPETIYVHPTFLYESLWNLLGFIIINLIYKKKKFDGQILLIYIAWYGLGRMFIEGLRADSLYVGNIRISQLVAFVTFVCATMLLVVMLVLARRGRFAPTVFMETVSGESVNSVETAAGESADTVSKETASDTGTSANAESAAGVEPGESKETENNAKDIGSK
jgi:phosphatidylglycerol:prolipoprotein diacylglycerol transferase